MTQIAQGDVLFTKIEKIPKDFKGKFTKIKDFVVAHGESGNRHRVMVVEKTDLVEIADAGNGNFYLTIEDKAMIDHEQHKPAQILDAGIWFVSRQTEFSPQKERLMRD